ncbi:MAG: hypothetical protein NDI62_02830 [Burkholderiales bacterium]|nr:hypothetical protein [Burkholderiales bacterium]
MRKALFSLFLALFTTVSMLALPPGTTTLSGATSGMSIADCPTSTGSVTMIATTAAIIENSGSPPVNAIALVNNFKAAGLLIASELDVYTPLKFLLTNQPSVVVGVFEDSVVVSQQNVVMFNERNLSKQSKLKAEAANFSPELYVSLVLV